MCDDFHFRGTTREQKKGCQQQSKALKGFHAMRSPFRQTDASGCHWLW
jgi:hypothetical protein